VTPFTLQGPGGLAAKNWRISPGKGEHLAWKEKVVDYFDR
jgi:hypothetical protein